MFVQLILNCSTKQGTFYIIFSDYGFSSFHGLIDAFVRKHRSEGPIQQQLQSQPVHPKKRYGERTHSFQFG